MKTEISIDLVDLPTAVKENFEKTLPHTLEQLELLSKGRCPGASLTGWLSYPQKKGLTLADALIEWREEISLQYDAVVVVGIGGSYLGCRALYEALYDGQQHPVFFLGHHLSSHQTQQTLNQLQRYSPLITVISKSGTTLEPAIALRLLADTLINKHGSSWFHQRVIAITDARHGTLKQLADTYHWKTFAIPDDVGGRYSALTPVGLVPLTLLGFNIRELMQGADDVFNTLYFSDGIPNAKHPSIVYATTRQACYQNGKLIELLAYNQPQLHYFCAWWQQLFAESEAKNGRGVFPAGMQYTTDLHSLGQLVQEGERNLFETFLFFNQSTFQQLKIPRLPELPDQLSYLEGQDLEAINEIALQASRQAHTKGGVPCTEIHLKALDERHLGGLIAFFETSCALSALVQGVNPFNQPGVEAYKKNMFAMLGRS